MPFEKCWIGCKTPEIQWSSCIPRWYCKRTIQVLMQYSLNEDLQHQKWQRQKSWISFPDCPVAQDKQRTQYLLIPGKNGRCSKITENSQIGMSRRLLDSSTSTQMAKITVQHGKTQSFLLSAICTVILWQGLLWERQFEKIFLQHGLGRRFPIGNAYSYTVKKGYSYLCMWMTSNWLERNKTLIRCGKYKIKKSIWENQHLSLIMYFWGCTQRQCGNKSRYCWQLQNHVWIQNFRGENWKTSMFREFSCFFVVLWYGRSCQEMCGTILWVSKQDDSTTLQSIYSMHRWPSLFKEEELKSVGELSKACSQIVLKCLYLARIGRPDILWSVNKLARSITKWTKASDKRLCRLISYIHHTREYKQYC